MTKIIKIFALIPVLFASQAYAQKCDYNFTLEMWLKSYDSELEKQKPMFDMLSKCLKDDVEAQRKVDYLVIKSIVSIHRLNEEHQIPFLEYNIKALHINAKAGFAPSQHNYAALHNSDPSSFEFNLIPQRYELFLYWTKMAASQGEPRAMFNLASRYANEDPPVAMEYDPELAYSLYAILLRDYGGNPSMPKGMLEYAKIDMERLRDIIGVEKSENIQFSLATFDYKSLAPSEGYNDLE